jgi:phosphopentomutase
MRALLIVLDSVGIGAAPDAKSYGDLGSDTLGHIRAAIPDMSLPNLCELGLDKILDGTTNPSASYGRMRERSAGKDTTTGHWEIAGVVLDEPFQVFTRFPDKLVHAIEAEAKVTFIGNYAQSGTAILEELGREHLKSRQPILYTSADSVMQIAAHEEVLPAARLNQLCRIARRHCDTYRIGRVIARPFSGTVGKFVRTAGRHDYSLTPPHTILNAISDRGFTVEGVGKISDIFAGSGITHSRKTKSNAEGMQKINERWHSMHHGLIFANLVDFDTLYGHRRDPAGYARALEEFDSWLGDLLPHVEHEDLLIITADHGNDPTFGGTDHTREDVPLLIKFEDQAVDLGVRESFADVAATLSAFFHLPEKWPIGKSCLCPKSDRARSLVRS